MRDIERLSFTYDVRQNMQKILPKEQLEEIIKHELMRQIAKFINNNLDDLPIEKTVIKREGGPSIEPTEEHRISFYIISKEELRRLEANDKGYTLRGEI